jgi:putative membrane protein
MMDGGSWAWWWMPGILFMALCMGMMVWMMSGHRSHGSHDSRSDEPDGNGSASARRILAERLARGEIDAEEYEHRLRVLQQNRELDRTSGEHGQRI